ncbi:hypothetical protein PROFUN_13948 [Planoprotostelium fungivorum]|uniref:Uncharacterized protein n=1 Tax=Planoprotostelium fungivorum TaxID=1890364 RepID=A0A2P6N2G7_9EUKA|nr:hypothetical protein PROFUN_13948 [Planoprotostelium fungivorum]
MTRVPRFQTLKMSDPLKLPSSDQARSEGCRIFRPTVVLETLDTVRAIMDATRTYSNGTVYLVQHYYEFVNFVAKKPLDMWFDVPSQCKSNAAAIIQLVKTETGTGLAVGMLILGFAVGLIAAIVSCLVYQRHAKFMDRNRMELAELSNNAQHLDATQRNTTVESSEQTQPDMAQLVARFLVRVRVLGLFVFSICSLFAIRKQLQTIAYGSNIDRVIVHALGD